MNDILWSELRLHDGSTPGADDIIVINSGDRLVLDAAAGPAVVKGLVIYGEFTVEDSGAELSLTTDWAVAVDNGAFRVGSAENPYESQFTLTLAGKDPFNEVDLSEYPDGGSGHMTPGDHMPGDHMPGDHMPGDHMPGDHMPDGHMPDGHMSHHVITNNDAFLMAMGDGASIEIHVDDADKESWTQLASTADAGDTTLTFTDPTGWEVGDRIAIASTDFDMNQAETSVIAEVREGGRVVVLEEPLGHMHYGEIEYYDDNARSIDMRAEVALLSRDVTIQGDVEYDESRELNQQVDQFGGNTMVMMGGEMYVSGVEFQYMGQAGILGRYPAHWHLSEDVSGQYIQNSSIHHTFNNGITVHGAENALVENNVIFETVGHGIFLEDGSEIGNQLIDNLAFGQRAPGLFGGTPSGRQDSPSSFWIENAGNTISGNHAAGSEDTGFFFDLHGNVNDPSRSIDGLLDNESQEGPSDMVGNVSHSSDRAFFLNHRDLIRDHDPSGDLAQAQKVAPWSVEDFTAYKIDGRGLYVRGVEGTFIDVKMAEVGEGTRFRLNQGIEDALIVGRSKGNTGTPTTDEEIAAGRSLPNGEGSFSGHLLYDGPAGISNVHFDGFYHPQDHAIAVTGAVHKSSLHYVQALTWGEEQSMPWSQRLEFGVYNAEMRETSEMLVDLDGSLTGIEGGAILNDEPRRQDKSYGFHRSENAVIFDEWGAVANPSADVAFIGLMNVRVVDEYGNYNGNDTPYDVSDFEIDVLRSDGPILDELFVGPGLQYRQVSIVDGYTYEMTLRGDPLQFQFYMSDMPAGTSAIYKVNGLKQDTLFYLKNPNTREIIDISEVSSMERLLASPETSVFRDLTTGDTHLKFVSQMFHGYDFAKPQATRDDALTGGVIVNVDQREESLIDLENITYNEPGLFEWSGTDAADVIEVNSDFTSYRLIGGEDVISGEVESFLGDTFSGFGVETTIILRGELASYELRGLDNSSVVVEVIAESASVAGVTFTLEGDFSGGEFMLVGDGSDTYLTFETYLPVLGSGQTVEEGRINGVNNQLFLTGDGERAFSISIEDLGDASFENAIGVYEITESGEIIEERILFQNVKNGGTLVLEDVEAGNTLGFFLIQDGADRVDEFVAADQFDFVDDSGRSAYIDGGPLRLAVDGQVTDEIVFHSFDASLNPDGLEHTISGVAPGGNSIILGFEDLLGGGDRDFEDVGLIIEQIDYNSIL
ncbi:MAG: G8 domain-containing protein [Pseudomonadota bacterium]